MAGRRQALALGVSLALNTLGPQPAPAAEADEQVALYFGAGCFWHVQHEFTLHEQATLARRGAEISATSGYAGGTRLGDKSRVCYHNMQQLADYGALGHGEVVQVTIPASAVGSFSEKFFGIFGKQGIRHDPQDRGGEVRARTATRTTRTIHLPTPVRPHSPPQSRAGAVPLAARSEGRDEVAVLPDDPRGGGELSDAPRRRPRRRGRHSQR